MPRRWLEPGLVASLAAAVLAAVLLPGTAEGGGLGASTTLFVLGNAPASVRVDRYAYRNGRLTRDSSAQASLQRLGYPEQRVTVARLAPSHRWLAIGTGADPIELNPEPDPAFIMRRTLSIVEASSGRIALQQAETKDGRFDEWFAWTSKGSLVVCRKDSELDPPPRRTEWYTLVPPTWRKVPLRGAMDEDTFSQLQDRARKPSPLEKKVKKLAAEVLEGRGIKPRQLGTHLLNRPSWEVQLNDIFGSASLDGKRIVVIRKETPERTDVSFLARRSDGVWTQFDRSFSERIYSLQFHDDRLLMTAGKETAERVLVFRSGTFALESTLPGSLLIVPPAEVSRWHQGLFPKLPLFRPPQENLAPDQ
jgi:hypothetical protein